MKKDRTLPMVLSASLLLLAPHAASADSEIILYGWFTDISGDATLGQQDVSFAADFDDLLDKTESALMLHFESGGDAWGGGLDVFFTELEDENNGIESTVDTTIIEAFATYAVNDTFDLIGGVRNASIEVDVEVPGRPTASGEGDLTDAFIGGRATLPLGDQGAAVIRADIGGGDSDQVVNALIAFRWLFANNWTLSAGYRWLDYEFEGEDTRVPTEFDMTFEGFLIGVGYRF